MIGCRAVKPLLYAHAMGCAGERTRRIGGRHLQWCDSCYEAVVRSENLEQRALPVPDASLPSQNGDVRQVTVLRQSPAVGLLTLFALLTHALRAVNLTDAFDIHVDEVIYYGISQNMADHFRLAFFGGPFYLHPPAFFLWEAAYIKLFQPAGDVIHQVYAVRPVNLVFAGVSAALLFLIGRKAVGWHAGLAAAGIFALDPFVIRMNSVNLLDTSAIAWVLVGHYLILHVPVRDLDGEGRRWRLPWHAVAAGAGYGLALLTKEQTAPLTLLPLGVCFTLNWALPRRTSMLIGTTTLATYAIYPATIAAMGDWENFQQQKLDGLARFVGLIHETGFKQTGGPSFVQAIVSNLDQYATTYTLIGSGVIAIYVLLLVGDTRARLLATWTGSAYALLAFSLAHGTLEEQFFYFLVVPSIMGTTAAALLLVQIPVDAHLVCLPAIGGGSRWLNRTWASKQTRFLALWHRLRRPALVLIAGAGLVFLGWSGNIWARVHFTPDNGYERLATFFAQQVPDRSRVAVTSTSAAIILTDAVQGKVVSPDELVATGADYLELSTKNVENNYGEPSPEFNAWIVEHGQPVFSFRGRSYGTLIVYYVPNRP